MVKRKREPKSTPDAVACDFAALGNAVLDIITTIGREHWSKDSPAGLEEAEESTYADRYPLGLKPIKEAQLAAIGGLPSIGDSLRGMADCLAGQANVFSTISLARVVTSAAASTFWRLEPDIGPRERVRRNVALQLGAIADRARIVGRDRHSQTYSSIDRERQAFLAWGRRHGFAMNKVGRDHDHVQQWTVGDRVPGEMHQIRALLDSLGPEMSDVTYRITSAFVHSTSNSLLLTSVPLPGVSAHGVAQANIGMSSGRLILFTSSAVYGTNTAALRLLNHYGMDATGWNHIAQPLLVRWADATRAELVAHPNVIG